MKEKDLSRNQDSIAIFDELYSSPQTFGSIAQVVDDVRIVDLGVSCNGGVSAGISLAKISAGGLADISVLKSSILQSNPTCVQFRTDHPLSCCIGSQYAGWPISHNSYFAMGSGPIRAIRQKEKILAEYDLVESDESGVLCLESAHLPNSDVISLIVNETGIDRSQLRIAVAPTRSIAGSIQVVARSVETCLHKLHEVGFDLRQIVSGIGIAPVPPIAADDLKGIGMTNDAILYGGDVELWVKCSDDQLAEIGPQTPSGASADYGRPFYELFKANDFDFYKIDPLLFSPAKVSFHNLLSGRSFQFGSLNEDLVSKSFGVQV